MFLCLRAGHLETAACLDGSPTGFRPRGAGSIGQWAEPRHSVADVSCAANKEHRRGEENNVQREVMGGRNNPPFSRQWMPLCPVVTNKLDPPTSKMESLPQPDDYQERNGRRCETTPVALSSPFLLPGLTLPCQKVGWVGGVKRVAICASVSVPRWAGNTEMCGAKADLIGVGHLWGRVLVASIIQPRLLAPWERGSTMTVIQNAKGSHCKYRTCTGSFYVSLLDPTPSPNSFPPFGVALEAICRRRWTSRPSGQGPWREPHKRCEAAPAGRRAGLPTLSPPAIARHGGPWTTQRGLNSTSWGPCLPGLKRCLRGQGRVISRWSRLSCRDGHARAFNASSRG